MKISGPGSKLPPEAPGATDEPKRSGSSAFADKVAGQNQVDAPGRTAGTHLIADVAADLSAGRITPQVALDRVIDRVVDQQVGRGAPPGVRERVSSALRAALEEDPLLAEKLKSLGG
jgi:hypothetical protein